MIGTRTRAGLVLALTLALAFAGCASTTDEPGGQDAGTSQDACERPGWATYESEEGAWRMCYPPGWTQEGVVRGVTTFLPEEEIGSQDGFAENVNVLSTTVPAGTVLDEQIDATVTELEDAFPGFELVRSTPGEHGGLPAHTLVYEAERTGEPFVWQQRMILEDGSLYVLTYTAQQAEYERYLGSVQDAWGTFEIL